MEQPARWFVSGIYFNIYAVGIVMAWYFDVRNMEIMSLTCAAFAVMGFYRGLEVWRGPSSHLPH